MGEKTSIGWTHRTLNFLWGCHEVEGDPACENCYAREYAKFRGFNVWGDNVPRRELSDPYWKQAIKWNREAHENGEQVLVFTSSMADVYERPVDKTVRVQVEGARERLHDTIDRTPFLTYQVLTKRPHVAKEYLAKRYGTSIPQNIWLGVTAVTQKWFDLRVAILTTIPARVRFVSCEPLVERVDVSRGVEQRYEYKNPSGDEVDLTKPLPRINWLIVGGESGNGRREMDISWLTSIVKQCKTAGVPCFVKQDSHRYPEKQGRIPDDIWKVKEFPA